MSRSDAPRTAAPRSDDRSPRAATRIASRPHVRARTLPAVAGSALLPLGAMLSGPAAAQATPERELPSVEVRSQAERATGTGYQGGTTTIGKTPQLPRDIPQAVTIVPQSLIRDQGADTVREALRNVPGLTFNAGEGGRVGDNITIRGYSAVGDLYLDGIRDNAQYTRETFNLEQIDVLRGSASMLFGRGSTGGVINQVSKQPGLVAATRVGASIGTYGYQRYLLDMNAPTGQNAALRLNAMYTSGDSFRDVVRFDKSGVAPSFRWGIGTANEFSIGHYYLDYDGVPDYGVPYFGGRPLDVPVKRFYGLATDYQRERTNITTASWIHRFSPQSNVRTVLRHGTFARDLWATAPRLAAGTTAITDATGINRQRQARGAEERNTTLQSDFTTKLTGLGLKHDLLVGVEMIRENAYRWNNTSAAANPATTVGDPNASPVLPSNYFTSFQRTGEVRFGGETLGIYAQDTIEFRPGWKLMAGARHDNFKADYERPAPQGDLSRTDKVLSWRTGLIWQPTDEQSYYVAYGTAFNPSAELYALDDRSANTDPEKSRNIEGGGKWELFEGNLSLRTAVFRTEKTNERNTDLSNPTVFLLSGKRHTDGIEVEAAGRITPLWEVFAGVARMWSRIDEASFQQANTQGKVPLNTPPWTVNVWSTYRLGGPWRVAGGFNGAGKRYGDNANNNVNPGYIRWDAMVAYEQRLWALRLNLLNLLDKRYYEGVYAGHTVPGTSRTAMLSFEYRVQ